MGLMKLQSVEVKKSNLDASVNFICKGDFPGYLEARYVRRSPEYIICYLSSQSGCSQGCQFCHLTATKQIDLENADLAAYEQQADIVLKYYDSLNQPAQRIHFGFMARGEILANPHITKEKDYSILQMLAHKALDRNLFPRYTISTILPKIILGRRLIDMFPVIHPDLYYSIYSMDPIFRKKWMNNALPAEEGLDMLTAWQEKTRKIIKLHWSFIENENDSPESVLAICDAVNARKLRVDVNLVKYNPASDQRGRETDVVVVNNLAGLLRRELPDAKVKLVDRVGNDVYASCGTFVPK